MQLRRPLRTLSLLAASATALAQTKEPDKPLFQLPYSPSLDLKSMDRKIDPCVDFYRYACNGWIQANPIPPDQSAWDVYRKLTADNERFLWGLLQRASQPSPVRTKIQTEIGDYFAACMDEAAIEKAGATPLRPDLASIAALKSIADLPALLGRVHLTVQGNGMLFGVGSSQDFEDASRVIAFAEAGGIGLPDRDYYTKTDAKSVETRQKYVGHIEKMLALSGETATAAKADAQKILDLETEFAKVSLTRVERRDPHNLLHKMTLAQLKVLTPSFRWDAYLPALGSGASFAIFNVTEPKFYEELDRQLKSRPIEDWRAYLRWHLVHARASMLSSAFVNANFEFYSQYLRGLKEMPPRWKRCVRGVDGDLGEALGQEFVSKTFTPQTKDRAITMTKEVENAMEREINQLPWMDDATRKQAIAKLHMVVNKIGYPNKWRDYSSIRISRNDYAGNVSRAAIFEAHREMNKIGKPVDRTEWGMTPPTVNAYYDPQMNDINFPAGVLQPPLYDPNLDEAPNFGNTGATIGHELTHAFDDEGSQFDGAGNLKNWWTDKDGKEFADRAKCVSDQYSNYTVVDDIKLNGKLTLGEDLADVGGTLLAYLAWKDATKGQDLPPVDGLTPDQRFFIGMAQWACGAERPEILRMNAITNPHSPLEDRINGVVSNMPEFRQAFSCKAGQPMVNANSCKVW